MCIRDRSRIQNRFHIFVAIDHKVDGTKAYESLMTTIGTQSLTPSQQILYLFSGGYKPGRHVLIDKGADTFLWIYLVDIWMGVRDEQHSIIPDFYKHLVNANRKKITYVYTYGGANNPEARDSIAKTLGSQNAILVNSQKGDKGLDTHMRTNTVAVGMLP